MKKIAILGATGSIGSSALDVIQRHPERFEVTALAAHRNVNQLLELCARFRPKMVVIADSSLSTPMQAGLKNRGLSAIELYSGAEALDHIAASSEVDTVIAAIVGSAGLSSTLAAAKAGKTLLLANKEAVVMAGALLFDALHHQARIIPLDSEHNAIFQCLPAGFRRNPALHGVQRIVLTASGGPFRGYSREQLRAVTPEQALRHPRWNMGRKISVDSATLINKGLEVIEAHWLFGLAADQIDVVVHPQSVVHSFVEYADGSLLAQAGPADMRTPIAQALAWPERIASGVQYLNLLEAGPLQFEAADTHVFPCLALARQVLREGGSAPAILNAANEVAVDAFLTGSLPFSGISDVIEATLSTQIVSDVSTLAAVMACDAEARRVACGHIKTLGFSNV